MRTIAGERLSCDRSDVKIGRPARQELHSFKLAVFQAHRLSEDGKEKQCCSTKESDKQLRRQVSSIAMRVAKDRATAATG